MPFSLRSLMGALRAKPLFWMWPFGVLVDAIRNFRRPHSKVIVWLFCVYFGFVFVYDDPFAEGGADSARYAAQLIEMHHSQQSLRSVISTFYNQDTEGRVEMDIYKKLATWSISRFTGNPRWLFTLYAAVFGFFYCGNLWLILEHVSREVKIGLIWALLALLFAFVNPIWNINGVRMYTAAHVFCFGTLLLIMKKDRRGFIWASSSVLIHFSFFLPLAVLVIFYFIPKNLTVLIVVFYVCAFVNLIDLETTRNLLSFMPEIYQDRMDGYTRDVFAAELAARYAELSAHRQIADTCRKLVMYFIPLVLYFFQGFWLNYRPFMKTLFAFALFFGSFALVVDQIPSAGRMLTIAEFFLLGCFVVVLSLPRFAKVVFPWVSLYTPILIFYFLFEVRSGLGRSCIMTYVGNPVVAFFVQNDVSVLDLIKSLL